VALGEVTGAGPLGSHVASCGLRRAQAVTVGGPGVEQHQAAHQAPGPTLSSSGSGRPSRRQVDSFPLCAEGAVTCHVEVLRFAGHGCSSAFLVDVGGAEHMSVSRHVPSTVRPCWAPVAPQRRDGPHAPSDRQQCSPGRTTRRFSGRSADRCRSATVHRRRRGGALLRRRRARGGQRLDTGYVGSTPATSGTRRATAGGLQVRHAREDDHRLTTQPTARVRSSRTGPVPPAGTSS